MERVKKEGAEGTTMEVTGEGMGEEDMVMTITEEGMATTMATVGVTGMTMVTERGEGRGLGRLALSRVHTASATIAKYVHCFQNELQSNKIYFSASMVTSIVERAGVKGEKEDMVVVGRVGREVEADMGQLSYSFQFLPLFSEHSYLHLFAILFMAYFCTYVLYIRKGRKYCYGDSEGEYCHCDYCKCKHGYGLKVRFFIHTIETRALLWIFCCVLNLY